MSEKLGQEQAFPFIEEIQGHHEKYWQTTIGMNKRFYVACAAMQGILSSSVIMEVVRNVSSARGQNDSQIIAAVAFDMADEMLKQEGAKS